MSTLPRKRQSRSGVILLTAAGLIVVLLAFVGLAFDVGYLQWQRRRAQSAADGGAMAGAWAKNTGASIVTKGQLGAAKNGFTDSVDGVTVAINNPPTQGAYAGNANYVEAIVSQDAPSFFMRVLNWTTLPIRARAVANTKSYDQACVYALDPSGNPGLKFAGNVDMTFGCGVVSESTRNPATTISGSNHITMNNGATIGSVGQTVINGGGYITPNSVASNINSPLDPLASLAMPTTLITANCYQGTALDVSAGPCADHHDELPTGGNYHPGVYCGGISINGGDNANFAPGLYILAGRPGLTINTGGTVSGAGITFYLTDTTGWNCTGLNGSSGNGGSVSMSGQAVITWNAPTNGTYAGILMFENRALTNVPASTINGGATSTMNGAFYFPQTDPLNFSGNSSVDGYIMILAKTVNFTGATTLNLLNFPADFANNFPAFASWVTMAE